MTHDEEMIEMLKWINNELASGKSKEEIVTILTGEDGNRESSEKIVDTAIEYKLMLNETISKNTNSSIPPFIKTIIALVLMFAIGNGVLYGIQEVYYWNDVKKCELMKININKIKKEVEKIEDFVNLRKIELDRLKQLQKEIKQGLSKNYTKYNKMVDNYNSGTNKYQKDMEEYDSLIVKYNKLTRKYNDLSKDAYSRWWLLPIPLPAKAH